jgi:hypothetical protein
MPSTAAGKALEKISDGIIADRILEVKLLKIWTTFEVRIYNPLSSSITYKSSYSSAQYLAL